MKGKFFFTKIYFYKKKYLNWVSFFVVYMQNCYIEGSTYSLHNWFMLWPSKEAYTRRPILTAYRYRPSIINTFLAKHHSRFTHLIKLKRFREVEKMILRKKLFVCKKKYTYRERKVRWKHIQIKYKNEILKSIQSYIFLKWRVLFMKKNTFSETIK